MGLALPVRFLDRVPYGDDPLGSAAGPPWADGMEDADRDLVMGCELTAADLDEDSATRDRTGDLERGTEGAASLLVAAEAEGLSRVSAWLLPWPFGLSVSSAMLCLFFTDRPCNGAFAKTQDLLKKVPDGGDDGVYYIDWSF